MPRGGYSSLFIAYCAYKSVLSQERFLFFPSALKGDSDAKKDKVEEAHRNPREEEEKSNERDSPKEGNNGVSRPHPSVFFLERVKHGDSGKGERENE